MSDSFLPCRDDADASHAWRTSRRSMWRRNTGDTTSAGSSANVAQVRQGNAPAEQCRRYWRCHQSCLCCLHSRGTILPSNRYSYLDVRCSLNEFWIAGRKNDKKQASFPYKKSKTSKQKTIINFVTKIHKKIHGKVPRKLITTEKYYKCGV